MSEKSTSQAQAARRISALLAQAEDAARRGQDQERAGFLEKATALQFKYAVDGAMLAAETGNAEEVVLGMFCNDGRTPLIRARRELVAVVALFFGAKTAQVKPGGQVKVFAHTSTMQMIDQMYTSLLLQLNSMLLTDEGKLHGKPSPGWRLAYARGWVNKVYNRLMVIKSFETAREPGTALVVVSRDQLVQKAFDDYYSGQKLRKGSAYSKSNQNRAGLAAGRQAGERADLGQQRVENRVRGEIS